MSGFIYFVPSKTVVTAKDIQEIGLADRIDSHGHRKVLANGPDGGRGSIVWQKGEGVETPKMDSPSQQWRAAPRGDKDSPPYWIGYTSADPPGPESLARQLLHSGTHMTLESGMRWLIPHVRNWWESDSDECAAMFSTTLPQMVDFDEEGRAVPGTVTPRYREIWDQALDMHERLYESAVNSGTGKLTDSEIFQFAADVIGINYRVSLPELVMISALSTADCSAVTRIGLDLDAYENAVKNWASRLESATTDSQSGSDRQTEDDPTNIDPRLVN